MDKVTSGGILVIYDAPEYLGGAAGRTKWLYNVAELLHLKC